MAVTARTSDLLREAVRDQHPNETFEKALGRILRKNERSFEDYVMLISRVRVRAQKDGGSLEQAARALAEEE